MPVKKKWIKSSKPATQGDLSELQEDSYAEMSKMEGRLKKELASKKDLEQFATKQDLKEAIKGLMTQETGEELLKYVKEIDRHNKQHHDHPERIRKLEDDVFKLKLRR